MIDTVIIRLHGLKKNNAILKSLDVFNLTGYEAKSGIISFEDFLKLADQAPKRRKEAVEILQSRRTGDFLIKTQAGKQVNSSNHYSFVFRVDFIRDFIEFNFSIPKYQFGTNILMFVEHMTDPRYKDFNGIDLNYNIKNSYNLLCSFLKNVFIREFIMVNKIDLKDVEINRIDLCFNQVFTTKEHALLFLDYQKKLRKKYAHEENGVMREYSTSLMYVTKRYSVKIYHKGTEYEKNDLKEHKKINEEKRKEYFKIAKFQDFADKILRYEITIRNSLLNYLHKQFLFRCKCSIWKAAFKDYKIVEATKQYNDRVSKKVGKLKTEEEKKKYKIKNPYMFISPEKKYAHKIVTNIINRRRYFTMEVDFESLLFNRQTIPTNNDYVLFSSELLLICFKKFFGFVNEFQIKELPNDEIVKQKIEAYNLANNKKLPINEMMNFYNHLVKQGSFREAIKYTNLSRATLYRYISRFAEIGITEKSVSLVDSSYKIPNAPLDLRRYQNIVNFDSFLLRGIKVPSIYYSSG